MFAKKTILKIIAEKKEIFGTIPENVLTPDRVDELRAIPRLAVGEISGMQGLDGLYHRVAMLRPDALLPTVSYTGSEYGSWSDLGRALRAFKQCVEKNLRIFVAEPVILGAPDFWWALNQCFAAELYQRFQGAVQCCGCRLYSFALRVPLCKKVNAQFVIASGGLSAKHGCPAAQMHGRTMDYCGTLMKSFGLELCGDVVEASACSESSWGRGPFLQCVLRGTPHNASRKALAGRTEQDYFERFAIPACAKVLSKTFAGAGVDYVQQVGQTLVPAKEACAKRAVSAKRGPARLHRQRVPR